MSYTFYDRGIRPKGSPEISFDPFILVQMLSSQAQEDGSTSERRKRASKVFKFMVKTALDILPPKQRIVFYSLWIRSGGNKSKGVMEFSKRTGRSHFSEYNSAYKGISSLQNYFEKTGMSDYIIDYLKGIGVDGGDIKS